MYVCVCGNSSLGPGDFFSPFSLTETLKSSPAPNVFVRNSSISGFATMYLAWLAGISCLIRGLVVVGEALAVAAVVVFVARGAINHCDCRSRGRSRSRRSQGCEMEEVGMFLVSG